MPSKHSDDASVWRDLIESPEIKGLNGNKQAVISEIRVMRAALGRQIDNIASDGEISEERLISFIDCYKIPNKLRERVASAVRTAINDSAGAE
jgi:hypothetical protein